jgi:triacylglycerol lipase
MHGKLGPELLAGTQNLFAPLHADAPRASLKVQRDLAYGPDPRHRLDVFAPAGGGTTPRPILVYVHGGGFVRGNKHVDGTPFNDNIAVWACRHGMIGVTINYRLAPQHVWPAGAEDVAAATQWIAANAAGFGGDRNRIILFGHSAGAVHVASFVAHSEFHRPGGPGIAGAVLGSGVYDLTGRVSDLERMYFGATQELLAARSSASGLIESSTPLMVFLAELDPLMFERQAVDLVARFLDRHQRLPRFVRLAGDSHLSPVMHLGYDPGDRLGPEILDFIETECGPR